MEDVPHHSHITFGFLGSFETLNANAIFGGLDFGKQTQNPFPNLYTYLLLAEGTDPVAFEQKLAGFIDQNYGEVLVQNNTQISAALQPLTDIHLQSNLDAEISPNSDIAYIYIFMAVAVFLLQIVAEYNPPSTGRFHHTISVPALCEPLPEIHPVQLPANVR